ncbi:MAG: CarD family transcriptional regulator [Clostridia bacterium]|nr:CarD family transcriptional regulator [Clostridia bacterium]
MLKIGEKVVYGKTGVCIVEGQCEKELVRNQKRQYFVLKPLGSDNNTIFAPVEGNRVFIRPIMTRQEADELILKIPEITEASADIELTREQYEAMISTHNCEDLVGLTFRLYHKKKFALENRKKPGFVDERYMALAEKLLFGELAAALEIPFEEVKAYIGKKLNN